MGLFLKVFLYMGKSGGSYIMAYFRKQALREARETIDSAIRTCDVDPVIDSVVALASNDSFDDVFYRLGSLFLQSQGESNDMLWNQANSLARHSHEGVAILAQLIRLDLAFYELNERGDASYGITVVSDALMKHYKDKDVVVACERVISSFPYDLEHGFYEALSLIKK